ncbi:hypothetical protein D3C73_865690 [compost metagenome]
MDFERLKGPEKGKQLFKKAKLGFWEYVKSWKMEDPSEFYEAFKTDDISLISLENERIAYVINYRFDEPVEFIQTTLNVLFDDRLIAQYHYLQHLNGEVMDDVLSFE